MFILTIYVIFCRFAYFHQITPSFPKIGLRFLFFKLRFEQPGNFFHIVARVVLFPKGAVIFAYRLVSSHQRNAHNRRFRSRYVGPLHGKKALMPDDHETCFLQIFGIQKLAGKSHHIVIIFPLRFPLSLTGHQNAGNILKLGRRNTFCPGKRTVSGNLDEAAADGQKEIDIFFRKALR